MRSRKKREMIGASLAKGQGRRKKRRRRDTRPALCIFCEDLLFAAEEYRQEQSRERNSVIVLR